MGEAQNEIKALRATEVLKDKALDEVFEKYFPHLIIKTKNNTK